MRSVYIPVQNSEEEVSVDLDYLPRDSTDILDILKAEQAPLHLWLIIACEYYKQGKIEDFQQILEEGSSPEIDRYYADAKYDRVAILNALGAFYTNKAKYETKQKEEKETNFMHATGFFNKASKIDQHEPLSHIGKGQLCLARCEFDQASGYFSIALGGQPDYVPALLGQACVLFNRGRFVESLELYKKALQVCPACPAFVRLGLGLCRYKLGQFKKARQAFERVLQLDPENIEALVALGIMELQTNEADSYREGIDKMRRAVEIFPYCAMALNHLADHFYFTGKHFLVERLTEMALVSTQHPLMKSHSYYNLARSYHGKGDYETAGRYYMASVKESQKPQDFVLPYYGLGQIQMKCGDLKSALASFEKVLEVHPENCETLKAVGHIYVQQGQLAKALEMFRKATRIDPHDSQAFIEMGELLIISDASAALNALTVALNLLRKSREEIPIELLNNIGVLHFERGEFELAQRAFLEALGDGVWMDIANGRMHFPVVGSSSFSLLSRNIDIFQELEEEGTFVRLPWEKVTTVFNLGRLFEQVNDTEKACLLYRLLVFKFPDYVDAYLRLAAMAYARNNIQQSLELVGDALKADEKSVNALSMLGNLEVKAESLDKENFVKARTTFKLVDEGTGSKDSYAAVCLGNWYYHVGVRSDVKDPDRGKFFEKCREIYFNVLTRMPGNIYAANGTGIVLAENGSFDVAKDIFTQVQEAAAGNIFVQMPDVWVNLAHVYFAQEQFSLAVKMYQNCLKKFYHGTDTNILLYLARTYYQAEQWQDCKKTLLRAIHLAPSNYLFRFDAGIAMQKFSASTLQKQKKTADEVRQAISDLESALLIFSQLSGITSDHSHGFNEKKLDTHVSYCRNILDAAKTHLGAAERDEQQQRQKHELARQKNLAEEARRAADEQRKSKQIERIKQEEELKRVREQEENFARVKEQWRTGGKGGEDGSDSQPDRKRKKEKEKDKEKKRRRKDKSSKHHDSPLQGSDVGEDDDDVMVKKPEDAQDLLAAAGLDDSDDGEMNASISKKSRRRQAYSDSEDDMTIERHNAQENVEAYEPDFQEQHEAYEPQFQEPDGDNAAGLASEADAE